MRRFTVIPLLALLMVALVGSTALGAPQGRAALVTEQSAVATVTDASNALPAAGTLAVDDEFDVLVTITEIGWDATNETLEFSGEVFADGPVGTVPDGTSLGTFEEIAGTLVNGTGLTASAGALVAQGGGRCQILFLQLDGLFLDVLGLEVDLSQITLDITAVRGPGNLLGNLLCAVAGLLDPPGTSPVGNLLNQLTRLLTRINNLIGA